MIHIVFQKNDVDVLREAIQLDDSLLGEVIQIADDYAVGPLNDIYSQVGIDERKNWWREVLAGSEYEGTVDDGSVADDNKNMELLKEKLNANSEESIWIWAAQNQHDVSGYYWIISQLKHYQSRIFILYLNNLPFINDKGHIFYPTNLFEIRPKEFIKAKKLNRPVTPAEFEVDGEEWKKICDENKGVRILEGGKKLLQYDYDYYDKELMRFITPDWQKGNKILHSFFSKSKIFTGDAYLLWRIKLMVKDDKINAQGELKNPKDFELKLKN